MDDDVWNDAQDDGLEREGKARDIRFFNSGFREGVDEGRTQQVQVGFNAGFAAGCPQGERLGRLQGTLETLRILSGQVAGTSAALQVVQAEQGLQAKELTVSLCHRELCEIPESCPDGCKERFAEVRTGEERWVGLGQLISMNFAAFDGQGNLAELEAQVDQVMTDMGCQDVRQGGTLASGPA